MLAARADESHEHDQDGEAQTEGVRSAGFVAAAETHQAPEEGDGGEQEEHGGRVEADGGRHAVNVHQARAVSNHPLLFSKRQLTVFD